MDNKKSYSKILPIMTGIIFIIITFYSFIFGNENIDSSLYIAAITIAGGVFGSSIIWYCKKAQAENVFKLKASMYKIISEEQYEYNKKMLNLQKELDVDKDCIENLNYDSQLDELKQEAVDDISATINEHANDATSPLELEQY